MPYVSTRSWRLAPPGPRGGQVGGSGRSLSRRAIVEASRFRHAGGERETQIEQIDIKNYRLFKRVTLSDLRPLVVVVGANGAGKSTLFDVFSFLKDALTQNVASAVAKRGGFRSLVSRGHNGPIEITIKFRESGGRLATYMLRVGLDGATTRPVVERELLRYRRGQYGKPWHFLDFSRGSGNAITNEAAYGQADAKEQREEYKLESPDVLAIKGLGQFEKFRVVAEFRSLIENWHISDFHISEARPSAEAGFAEHLSTRGDNVAQVAQYLYEQHSDRFDLVLKSMRDRVPGIRDVKAKSTDDGRLVLQFRDGTFQDPFIARYVSDGTIKMFAYLILLNDPKPHPLLAIEEPENQLYPDLLHELSEEFRNYARRGGQVFASTHSPDFVNGVKLDEVFWLVKEDGFSTAYRASKHELLVKLLREGDSLGALWKQGFLGKTAP